MKFIYDSDSEVDEDLRDEIVWCYLPYLNLRKKVSSSAFNVKPKVRCSTNAT